MFCDNEIKSKSKKHLRYSKKGVVPLKCLIANDFLEEGICTRDCKNCEYKSI